MAEIQDTTPATAQQVEGGETVEDKVKDSGVTDDKGGVTADGKKKSSGGSWVTAPERMGNSAGEAIGNKMAPVGNTVGKGFETVTRPVGNVVDGLLGGVMRSGEAFGEVFGVGYGNKDMQKKKDDELEKDLEINNLDALTGKGSGPIGDGK